MELKNPTCHHRWGSSLGSNAFPVWWAQNFSASISVTFISTLASVIHKQTNPWPSFSAFTPWEGAGEGLCCEVTLVNWCPLFSMLLQAPSSRPSFTELFSGSCRPAPHLTTVLMQIKSNHPTTFSTDITALWLSSFQLRGGALAYFFCFCLFVFTGVIFWFHSSLSSLVVRGSLLWDVVSLMKPPSLVSALTKMFKHRFHTALPSPAICHPFSLCHLALEHKENLYMLPLYPQPLSIWFSPLPVHETLFLKVTNDSRPDLFCFVFPPADPTFNPSTAFSVVDNSLAFLSLSGSCDLTCSSFSAQVESIDTRGRVRAWGCIRSYHLLWLV